MAFAKPPGGGTAGPHVQLQDGRKEVIIENGIVRLTILKPSGIVSGLAFGGLDNFFEVANPETNRGYWDLNWCPPGAKDIFDVIHATEYHVIRKDHECVEVSFVRPYNPHAQPPMVPMTIDKRFLMLRGNTGFYTYAIYHRPQGVPDMTMSQTRFCIKLRDDKFHYMALADDRQRLMPGGKDRAPPRGKALSPVEACLLVNPVNPALRGEIDDKYHYSCDNKDNRVHGWISDAPPVGFWVINASDEYRNGGPVKQNLTSHCGPVSLSMYHSGHYAGPPCCPTWTGGEPWTKVFGPTFIHVNFAPRGVEHRSFLWQDAKAQMLAEVGAWPYSFPASADFLKANQRANVAGQLLVKDNFRSPGPYPAKYAFLGLAPPGAQGSWQTESKGYQFWSQADSNGKFVINHVRPGTYDLYAWVPGVYGEYKREGQSITLGPGQAVDFGQLIFEAPSQGPTIWEIGVPDRCSSKFYVPPPDPQHNNRLYLNNYPHRFRQHGLWEPYSKLFPTHDLVYTVGSSDWRKDWWWAHVPRIDAKGATSPTTWTIQFHLANVQSAGSYVLRLAFAAASNAAIQVFVNQPDRTKRPTFDTMQMGKDNAVARASHHGLYQAFDVTLSPKALKAGENNIYLCSRKASNSFVAAMYDYIRLEAPPHPVATH